MTQTYYVIAFEGWYYCDQYLSWESKLRLATLYDSKSEAQWIADQHHAEVLKVTMTLGPELT